MLDHNKLPGRAPAGKGLINSYWAKDWTRKHWDLDDAEIVEDAVAGVAAHVAGIENHVEVTNVRRISPAIPIAKPGTFKAMARFLSQEQATSRIKIAGDYTGGSSTNSSLCSGERAAGRLLTALGVTRLTSQGA
jgi:oxygen-dependent protoporphyrinogen oxidase